MIIDGLLFGDDERVAKWVNERCGDLRAPEGCYDSIGVVDNKEILIGGLVFFSAQDNDIMLAMALDSPLAAMKSKVAAVLNYPFKQLNKPRISAEISMSNRRCIRLALAMGFKLEGTKRLAADDGGDLGVFGLLADEFRLKDM